MRMFMIYLLMGSTNILRMAFLFTIAWMLCATAPGQSLDREQGMEHIVYHLVKEDNEHN